MFSFIPKPTKKRSSTRVKYATLYAILADIEALHERVHELAYYQIERPTPANGMGHTVLDISPHLPAHPYAPPSPSSSDLPTRYSHRSMPMQDHLPRYAYPPPPPPPPRYERRRSRSPDSPAPVFRQRGGFGAHETPKITRTAPDRRAERDNGKNREKRVRVRDRNVVEEEDSGSGSGSEESDDEDEEMRNAQGDRDRTDRRGGLGGRRVAV
jgi:hypothetical protein